MSDSNLKVPDNTPDPHVLRMMEFTARTNRSMRNAGIQGIGGFIDPRTGEIFVQSTDGTEIPEEFKRRLRQQLNEDDHD